jgi:hypothetical protein
VGSEPEVSPTGLPRVIPGTEADRRWRFYLHRYHCLGLAVVGENLGYLARDAQGGEVACLLFGAAAWRCAPREQALGWSSRERKEELSRVVNNTRFLVMPWVRVKTLASCVLRQVARRIRTGMAWIGWRRLLTGTGSGAAIIGRPTGDGWGRPKDAAARIEIVNCKFP